MAALFLEGVRWAVKKGYLRVNRVPGQLFVVEGHFISCCSERGVNVVLQQLRKAGHNLSRNRILVYEALTEKGLLVGVEPGQMSTFKGVSEGQALGRAFGDSGVADCDRCVVDRWRAVLGVGWRGSLDQERRGGIEQWQRG